MAKRPISKKKKIEKIEPEIVEITLPKKHEHLVSGRPKKVIYKYSEVGYTQSQVNSTIKSMLAMHYHELAEIQDDEEATMLERIVAKAMKADFDSGGSHFLDRLLNRVWGLPKVTFNKPDDEDDDKKYPPPVINVTGKVLSAKEIIKMKDLDG